MDGAEDGASRAASHIPEFSLSGRRERGLWNDGGELQWLSLLDLLWRQSRVRRRLTETDLRGPPQKSAFAAIARSLGSDWALAMSLAKGDRRENSKHSAQTSDADASYLCVLQEAIASAVAFESAGGMTAPQHVDALLGSLAAAEERAELPDRSRPGDATGMFIVESAKHPPSQIPPILHFVWCGPAPVPDFFMEIKQSWKTRSPLIHALWRDAEIGKLITLVRGKYHLTQRTIQPRLVSAGKELSVNWTLVDLARMAEREGRVGAKSDLVRLLVLHIYGGVYADVDMELIRDLPSCFLTDAKFLAGAQREDAVELGNALLACTPRHELLLHIIAQTVYSGVADQTAPMQVLHIVERHTGESALSRQKEPGMPLVRTDQEALDIISATGPGRLTRAVMNWLQCRASFPPCTPGANSVPRSHLSLPQLVAGLESVCICPPCVFYPVPNHARDSLGKRGEKVCRTKFLCTSSHRVKLSPSDSAAQQDLL